MFREVCFFRLRNLEFWFNPDNCYEYIYQISRTGEKTLLTTPKEDEYNGGIFKFIRVKVEEVSELIFMQALGSTFQNFIYSVKKDSFLKNPQFGYCSFGSGYSYLDQNYLEIQSGSHHEGEVKFKLNLTTHEFEKYRLKTGVS